ncbi:small ribosomal subunit protein bS18m-like [Ptychodera flava]|uniref:small ribosomal subunit protein bS18m-like n=1 Tax=Ptychodera flava TaxID=63121 RepID=UPI003969E47F
MSSCVVKIAVRASLPRVRQFFIAKRIVTSQNVPLFLRTDNRALFCTSAVQTDSKVVLSGLDTTHSTVVNNVTDPANEDDGKKDMPETEIEDPYKPARKKCLLCEHDIEVNYKNVRLLSQFVSPQTGNIYPRHVTGLCTHRQEEIVQNIKIARQIGYMPVVYKDTTFLKDPKLTDDRRRAS